MCTTCLSGWKLLLGVPIIYGVSDSDLDEVKVELPLPLGRCMRMEYSIKRCLQHDGIV